jgi:hypothetical protein
LPQCSNPARERAENERTIRLEKNLAVKSKNSNTLPVYFVEPVLDVDLLLLANIVEGTTTGGSLVATLVTPYRSYYKDYETCGVHKRVAKKRNVSALRCFSPQRLESASLVF